MTLDPTTLPLTMSEILDGAVLLLGFLICISTIYLLLLHLARAVRTRLDEARDAIVAGADDSASV
jgi:hypothetical protein